ncbi:MAG: hypothetical protein QM811_07885 [Pirellulales bacterium]
MTDKINAFEAICHIASIENWCWNLMCTTCGQKHFKYATKELAEGIHPEDPEWLTRLENDRCLAVRYGQVPPSIL